MCRSPIFNEVSSSKATALWKETSTRWFLADFANIFRLPIIMCFEWDEISSLFWKKKTKNKNKIGNNNNQMNSFISNQKSCFFVETYLLDFNTNLFFFFILYKPCIMKFSLITLSCTLHLKVKHLEAALWRFSEEKVF